MATLVSDLGAGAAAAAPARDDAGYPLRKACEAIAVPLLALLAAAAAFSLFLLALGKSPVELVGLVWRGAFGSWFAWQNTLQRAAPLMLTALAGERPRLNGLAAGAVEFVTKTVSPCQFVGIVREVLRRHAEQQDALEAEGCVH